MKTATIDFEKKKQTKENNIKIFYIKNTFKKGKSLSDFSKYIIKSWKKEIENISENIDNFLYK